MIEELLPKVLSLREVQKLLQQLLREHVSIRDLPTILETLLDTAPVTKNPVLLVESARQALGRALVRPLPAEDGGPRVVTLDHSIQEELSRAFSPQLSTSVAGGLQLPSCEGFSMACAVWPESRWAWRLQCCCARPRRVPSQAFAGSISAQSGGSVAGRDSPVVPVPSLGTVQ